MFIIFVSGDAMGVLKSLRKKIRKKRSFFAEYKEFLTTSQEVAADRFSAAEKDLYPCLDDKTQKTGFDAHYLYHTAWAVRRVLYNSPASHVDVSSFLYFSALLSASVPVKFYDYRPADVILSNLDTAAADLKSLPFEDSSVPSLSCMHTVEHIGLGRYGDALDPNGDLKAIDELKRVLAPGGLLYFVVPVGQPRICFNAHRIYSYEQIVEYMTPLELVEFSLIPDDGQLVGIVEHADPGIVSLQKYACGLFIFRKNDSR